MLARFKADPKKIRVSIRRVGNWWRATVSSRIADSSMSTSDPNPEKAVTYALEAAKRWDFDGIDLKMEWSYEHPQTVSK